MKKSLLFFMCYVLLGVGLLQAQTVRITGTVISSEDGLPIPGVSIIVKGTTNGVATNPDGKYELNVDANSQTLVFSFIGYKSQEIEIGGRAIIDVVLQSESIQMGELVVTGLGIRKDKQKLAYNVQEIKGEELLKSRQTNVINSLSGRVAGAVINQSSGEVGSSTSIVLRGFKSLTGNNQPLFVVDGIPFSNAKSGPTGINGGVDYGSGAMDINPDDIESISTLTGAAASSIYGSRAANGAIIITTKKGKKDKGLGINYSYDVSYKNPFVLPKFQNKYGQGQLNDDDSSPDYGKYQFDYVDGNGGGTFDDWDESWGPELDKGLMIRQFWSKGEPAPWVSHPNNVKDFFETGVTQTHNISFDMSNDKTIARFGYSNSKEKGMVPNTDLTKHNFSLNTEMKMTDKLTLNAKVNYSIDKSDNRNGIGYNGSGGRNVFNNLIWSARQVDFSSQLKDYWKDKANLVQYNWNAAYWNNPYFMLNECTNSFDKNRINGLIKIDYKFSESFSVFARVGNDYYTDRKKQITAMGYYGDSDGNFWEDNQKFNEINADFLATYKKSLFETINLSVSAGGSIMDRRENYHSLTIKSLIIPDLYGSVSAGALGSKDLYTWDQKKQIRSIYGILDAELPKGLNIGFNYRVDQSSTLPSSNNTYGYYTSSLAWLINKAFTLPEIIDLAKVRVSYAQVGNDTDPYSLRPTYSQGTPVLTGVPPFFLSTSLKNADLMPEITKSLEFGTEIRLFKNRIGLDFSYYNAETHNQILSVTLPSSTGFSTRVENIGIIANKGIEVKIDLGIIRSNSDGLNWDMNLTYAKNKSEVVKLKDNKQEIILSSWWDNSRVIAAEGVEFGTIKGLDFQRDEQGRVLVDDDGMPVGTKDGVLGHVQPDFTFGIYNSLSYKNFNLDFLIGGSIGGNQYSIFLQSGCSAGQLEESLQGREYTDEINGDPSKGYIVDGVNVNTGLPNTVGVRAWDYWKRGDYQKNWIIDASYVKLRSLSLGYTFNKSFLSKINISSVRISVYGNNLLMLYSPFKHYDPEQTIGGGNVGNLGYSWAQTPTARTFGLNLKLNF